MLSQSHKGFSGLFGVCNPAHDDTENRPGEQKPEVLCISFYHQCTVCSILKLLLLPCCVK